MNTFRVFWCFGTMEIFWVLLTLVVHISCHSDANAANEDLQSANIDDSTKDDINLPYKLRKSLPTLLRVDNELISGDDFYDQNLNVFKMLMNYLPTVPLEKRLRVLQRIAMQANENLVTPKNTDNPTPGFIDKLQKVEDLLDKYIQIVLPQMASVKATNEEQLQLQTQMAKAMTFLFTRGAEMVNKFLKKQNRPQFSESTSELPLAILPETTPDDTPLAKALLREINPQAVPQNINDVSENEPNAQRDSSADHDVLKSMLMNLLNLTEGAEGQDTSELDKYESVKEPSKYATLKRNKVIPMKDSHDLEEQVQHLNDSTPLLPVNETLRALAVTGSYGVLLELSNEMSVEELKEARDLFSLAINYAHNMVNQQNALQKKQFDELKCLEHVYNELILTKEGSIAKAETRIQQYENLSSRNKLDILKTISGLLPLVELLPSSHQLKQKILNSVQLLMKEVMKLKPETKEERTAKEQIILFLESYKENFYLHESKGTQESQYDESMDDNLNERNLKDHNHHHHHHKVNVQEPVISSDDNMYKLPSFDKDFLAKGKLVGMIVHFKRVDARRTDSDDDTEWQLPNFMITRRDLVTKQLEEAYDLLNKRIGDKVKRALKHMDLNKLNDTTKLNIQDMVRRSLSQVLHDFHNDPDQINSSITANLQKITKSVYDGNLSSLDFLTKLLAHDDEKAGSVSDSKEPNSALINEGAKSMEPPEEGFKGQSQESDNLSKKKVHSQKAINKLGSKTSYQKAFQVEEHGWLLQRNPPTRKPFIHQNSGEEPFDSTPQWENNNSDESGDRTAKKHDSEDLFGVLKSMFKEINDHNNDDDDEDKNIFNDGSNKHIKGRLIDKQKLFRSTAPVYRKQFNDKQNVEKDPEEMAYLVLKKIMGTSLRNSLRVFSSMGSLSEENKDKVRQIVEQKLQSTLNYLKKAQAKNALTRAALYEIGQKVYDGKLPVGTFLATMFESNKKVPLSKNLKETYEESATVSSTGKHVHSDVKDKKNFALGNKIQANTSHDDKTIAKSVHKMLRRMDDSESIRREAYENKLLLKLLQDVRKDTNSEDESSQKPETEEPEMVSYILVMKNDLPDVKKDGLVTVDLANLGNAMQVVPVGIIPANTKDKELKEMLEKVMGAIIDSNSFQDLEEALHEEESFRMKERILRSQYRRYAKPSRCNYNSKLAKVFGGSRWVVCQQPLTFQPSLYD